MRQSAFLQSLLLLTFQIPLTAHAFVQTVMPAGQVVKWNGANKLNLAGNPRNRSGLSDADVFSSVAKSLNRWKQSSSNRVNFDYWQGTSGNYVASSDYNGRSSFYFASQGGAQMDSGTIGLTQVWYNSNTGEILESDVELNDIHYQFTTNPSDSSSNGGNRVFIENVLTHEFGHAYGISHSGMGEATMLAVEWKNQAYLSCDEWSAVRASYGSNESVGTISGQITDESGRPVFGAHVTAISTRRGVAFASALSRADGSYTISGLEPTEYFILVEPFWTGASSVSTYYQGISSSVCGGQNFQRSFAVDSNLKTAQVVSVNTSGVNVQVHCSSQSGSASQPMIGTRDQASATSIAVSASSPTALIDRFDQTSSIYYKVNLTTGSFSAKAIASSLYSSTVVSLSLLNSSGTAIATSSTTGTLSTEATLSKTGIANGQYLLKVSGAALSSNFIAGGYRSVDANNFLALILSPSLASAPYTASLTDRPRCQTQDNFGSYSSPGGEPPVVSTGTPQGNEDSKPKVGFCGTVSRNPAESGQPPIHQIIGYLLPFAFAALFALYQLRKAHALV